MLQDLINLLHTNGMNTQMPINTLPKSCCPSSKIVYDYDAIKAIHGSNVGFGSDEPKSADALLIDVENEVINFIEMKDFNKSNPKVPKSLSVVDALILCKSEKEVRDKLEYFFQTKFEASKKILDSFMLLLDICNTNGIDEKFYPYILSNQCEKRVFFLIGISSRDFVRWSLQIKPLKYKYTYYKLGSADFIPASNFDQYFK